MTNTNNSWKKLLKLAIKFLKSTQLKKIFWTFGGGTALTYYYNHRYSRDIDIFLQDAQILTYLTPRLNDYILQQVKTYNEMSNSIKLSFENEDIDFIISPLLTKKPYSVINFEKNKIFIENPSEIVVKKMFYRTETFKTRDIFDLAVVIKYNEMDLIQNLEIFKSKLSELKNRVLLLNDIFQKEISNLKIYNTDISNTAIESVLNFINKYL